ncbi:TRAP transporter small permease [Limimaricola hongkongensis]|uniref:TRAP transporter small permease protein n=1 Tax=Limimaricola hongkongensis DSM 17492 TaxID=1122180 RepID=A0A017H8C9_9RHOB|nr:TRAP transporter small permease [Limimaricola hongkongensis]EYD70428.1 TRAP-type transport system, small permease component, predicted N-acetylneuraminate transporter [Limimaricola hongkongensis DSM 17492]
MSLSTTTRATARQIDRGARWLGAAIVAGFATMVVYVVVSRYLFATTPRWAEELPRLLLVWLTFVGAVSGFVRGSHFRAGLIDLTAMPPAWRRGFAALAGLASAVFLVVLAQTGARLALMTWSHQTTALSLPVGLFYLSLPVCCGFALAGLVLRGGRA